MPVLQYSGVPTVTPTETVSGNYQSLAAPATAFGSAQGEALSSLGAQFEKAGDKLADVAIQRQQLFNQVAVDEASTKWRDSVEKLIFGDPETGTLGFNGLKGKAQMDAYPVVRKQFTDLTDEHRGVLQNPIQQHLFDRANSQTRQFMIDTMGRAYDRANNLWTESVNAGNLEQAKQGLNRAAATNQWAEFDNYLKIGMDSVVKGVLAKGLSSEEAAGKRDAFVAYAVEEKAKGLILTDPIAAREFLKGHRGALKDPQKSIQLEHAVEDAAATKEAENIRNGVPNAPGLVRGGAVGVGQGHVAPKVERIDFARQYAESKGINPDAVVATMAGEGLNVYTGDNGTSFGDLQLHVGGGMGDQAIAAGINIRDPNTWKEQIKFGIDQMAANRDRGAAWYAGQWHGAPRWAAEAFAATAQPPAKTAVGEAPVPPPSPVRDSRGIVSPDNSTRRWYDGGWKVYRDGKWYPEIEGAAREIKPLVPGNIDLNNRPVVQNADGTVSTVRSMSFNEDGKEVLIPTVAADGSGILSNEDAIKQYKTTGQFLGKFATPAQATAYAEQLHQAQAKQYGKGPDRLILPDREPGELPDDQVPGLQKELDRILADPRSRDGQSMTKSGVKAYKEVRKEFNDAFANQQHARRLDLQAQQDQDRAVIREYQKRMTSDSPNYPTTDEVRKNPKLSNSAVEDLVGQIHRDVRPETDSNVSARNQRFMIARMDPDYTGDDKITNEKQIRQAYNRGELTWLDRNKTIDELYSLNDPEGKRWKTHIDQTFKAIEAKIVPQIIGLGHRAYNLDASAAPRADAWRQAVKAKIVEYQQTGKNPLDLFIPGTPENKNPNYVGGEGFLARFMGTIGDRTKDTVPVPGTAPTVDLATKGGIEDAFKKGLIPRRQAEERLRQLGIPYEDMREVPFAR